MSDIANPGAHPSEGPTPTEAAEAVIESVDSANAPAEGAIDVEGASDAELEDVLEDSESSEEEIAEAQQELSKRINMKINGEEQEFDLGNDDHIEKLREMAQKGEGADQKFQEASKMRKQMEAFAKMMQENPYEALRRLGHDPDKIAESHMERRLEEMAKSPEQIEREKLQKELEEIRAEKQELEERRAAEQRRAAQDQYSQKLDVDITTALESSTLPKSPLVLKRVAEYLMAGMKKNPNITVKDVMPVVERKIQSDIREMFGKMPEEMIEQMLGSDVTTKLRKRRLARAKRAPETAASVKPTGKSEIKATAPKKESAPKSAKDFFRDFGDL